MSLRMKRREISRRFVMKRRPRRSINPLVNPSVSGHGFRREAYGAFVKFRNFCGCAHAAAVLAVTCAAAVLSPARGADYAVGIIAGVDSVGVNRGNRSRDLNPSTFAALEIEVEDFLGGVVMTPTRIAGELRPLAIGYVEYRPRIDQYRVFVGARYYAFIDSSDFDFDIDSDGVIDKTGRKGFYEANLGVRRYFKKGEATLRAFYSPNVFGETGDALYVAASGKLYLGGPWSLRGHVGVSEFNDPRFNKDYWNYAVGVYTSFKGFDVFVRYSDTVNVDGPTDRIVVVGFERYLSLKSSGSADAPFGKILNDLIIDKAYLAQSGAAR